jgi:hypothetical protein
VNEAAVERLYQDGTLQAEKDGERTTASCPMPEGTEEAKWWHRGYDHVVLIRDRERAARERRELGLLREHAAELQLALGQMTSRYELERDARRGYDRQRSEWQAVSGEAHAALERLRGLLGKL